MPTRRPGPPASSSCRRTALAVLAVAWAAGPGAAFAAGAAPLLRVELRSVEQPRAMAAPAVPLKPGSVVVGTSGHVDGGSGSVTLRSSRGVPEVTAPALQVVVANGERARVRWQDEREQQQFELFWAALAPATGASAAAPSASTPGARPGVALRTERRTVERLLEVRPRWPGGNQPVQLTLALAQTPGADAAGAPALSVETTVAVPLGRWLAVARSAEAAAAPGTLPSPGRAIEVRVTRVPD